MEACTALVVRTGNCWCRINGLTSLNLTKLDVLSDLDTIKLGTAYKLDGQEITAVPATIEALERVEVVYEELQGWKHDISKVNHAACRQPFLHPQVTVL